MKIRRDERERKEGRVKAKSRRMKESLAGRSDRGMERRDKGTATKRSKGREEKRGCMCACVKA